MGFYMNDDEQKAIKTLMWGAVGVGVVGAGAFLATRYRIASSNQYIAKTGIFVGDISLSKQTLQLPFQRTQFYDMNPFGHNFELKCMSSEMIELKLPIAFTLQPVSPRNDVTKATNYARRMLNITTRDSHDTITNTLEGSTRTLAGQLCIDDLFHNREAFRSRVIEGIEVELDKIGLEIVTANIQEMGDYDEDNQYFSFRKQRAVESANYDAKVDVAEAKMKGTIGMKQREGQTRIKTAEIERDARIAENEREKVIAQSNAELEVVEAEATRASQQAVVEADIKVDMRRVEMERELEEKRRQRELESERASRLAPTLVNKELIETDAQANLYKVERDADAKAYAVEKAAGADMFRVERNAEASLYQAERDAQAILVKAEKEAAAIIALKMAEAQGVLAIKEAEAEGLQKVLDASGKNPELSKFYLGLNKDLPQKIAEEAAKGLQGLNPDVTIWTTDGNQNGDPVSNTFAGMARGLVPVLDAIKDKVTIPDYLPQAKSPNKSARIQS
jgi:flotillin